MKYGMVKSAIGRRLFSPVAARLLLFILILAGCSGNDKPRGLLSQGEMVRAMTELYLAEQRVATIGISRDSTARMFKELSPRILGKVGTTDSIFKVSFDYYMAHPVKMEEIYTALVDSLNLREQKMISNEVKQ